jgi:hypothetical protein
MSREELLGFLKEAVKRLEAEIPEKETDES